jgi:hypothetical protein
MIIDEAQDFSYMHFLVLNKPTKTMTVLIHKDESKAKKLADYLQSEIGKGFQI